MRNKFKFQTLSCGLPAGYSRYGKCPNDTGLGLETGVAYKTRGSRYLTRREVLPRVLLAVGLGSTSIIGGVSVVRVSLTEVRWNLLDTPNHTLESTAVV